MWSLSVGPWLLANGAALCGTSAPRSKVPRRQQRELVRAVIARRLERLDAVDTLAPCDQCAAARRALLDDEEGSLVPVNVNVHNRAMAMCVGELPVVQTLFAELAEAGVANEASYAALVRAHVGVGELAQALAVLRQLLDGGRCAPRVRTCAPLLQALAAAGAEAQVLGLWRRLRRRGVDFTPAEHCILLRMHGRAGSARSLARRLDALVAEFPRLAPAEGAELLRAVEDLGATARGGVARAARGSVDARGVCSCCGGTLRLLTLDADERAAACEVLLRRMAHRAPQLQAFARWLEKRPPFDYVLDAANIAYARQNYEGGAFSYAQIGAVVALLRSRGKRVLVLLPESYDQDELPNHTCSSEETSVRSAADAALLEGWRRDGLLYVCPRGIYDDLFWMFASVRSPTTGVVSNDAMRDHRLDLMPPRQFSRWRTSQILGFGFRTPASSAPAAGAQVGGAGADADAPLAPPPAEDEELIEEVGAAPWVAQPPAYSHEAHRIGDTWHVPIVSDGEGDGPAAVEWVCATVRAA